MRTLLTSVLTGCSSTSDEGAGTRSRLATSRSRISGSSHVSQALGGSITGIRSWTGRTFSLGSPVMIVQDRRVPPPASRSASDALGSFHTDHNPAKANGSPSGRCMYIGCFFFWPGTFIHS